MLRFLCKSGRARPDPRLILRRNGYCPTAHPVTVATRRGCRSHLRPCDNGVETPTRRQCSVRPKRRGAQLLTVLVAFVLLAITACSSDDNKTNTAGGGSESSVAVPKGGTLIIGAEQEPDCMDWIGTCSGSSWGYWMAAVQTMPRAFDVNRDDQGDYPYKREQRAQGRAQARDVAAAEGHVRDRRQRGVERQRRRSRRPTSSTRGTRSPTARTSTTRPATRTSRRSTTRTRRSRS